MRLVVALLLIAPLAGASPVVPDAHGPIADAAGLQDPPLAESGGQPRTHAPAVASTDEAARAQARTEFERFLDAARLDPDDPDLPLALRHMDMMMGNHTNGTVLAHDHNGTNSHRHGAVGGNGLDEVWTMAFYGTPRIIKTADVDADGVADAIIGSDTALFAVSGKTAERIWARHIGSTISGLDVADVHPRSGAEVVFSTYWGGQRPRVAVVDSTDGALLWEHVGQAGFLGAAVTGDGHVIAVDLLGQHTTLDGVSGEAVRTVQPDLVPSTNALVAGYQNHGHYIADFADITGDGVVDSISVGLHGYYAYVPVVLFSFNTYSTVYVVDGATGETAWVHPVTTEPGIDGFTQTILTALSPIDHDGDGTQEIAFAGLAFRYHGVVPLVGFSYESFLRVIDQHGPAAVPVSAKELVSPLLPIEIISKIEPVDVQGDGREEVGVLRWSLLDGLLGDTALHYERYAVGLGAAGSPTMIAVPDLRIPLETSASLWPGEDGIHILTLGDNLAGRTIGIAPDGSTQWDLTVPSGRATSAAMASGRLALGTSSAIELRDGDYTQVAGAFPVRGVPVDFATGDHDGDGYTDAVIASTDGNVYVVDGVTGRAMHTLDIGFPVHAIEATGDGAWFLFYEGEDYVDHAGRWDGGTRLLWSKQVDRFLPTLVDLNGDRTLDIVSEVSGEGVTVLSGRDGSVLMQSDEGFASGRAVDGLSGPHGGLVVVTTGGGFFSEDPEQTFTAIDRDGDVAWNVTIEMDWWSFALCHAAADLDGDGHDSFVIVYGRELIESIVIERDGSRSPLGGMPRAERFYECFVDAVPTRGADELMVGLVYRTPDNGLQSGFGRHDGEAWGWQEFAADRFDALGGILPLGIHEAGQGGRFYFGDEDHVIVARWDTGDQLGQFTLDGPFVIGGTVVNLDQRGPAEVLALTADGLLWALATDAEEVTRALEEEALRQGKADSGTLPDDPSKKESPLPWVVVPVALAFARRRHSR